MTTSITIWGTDPLTKQETEQVVNIDVDYTPFVNLSHDLSKVIVNAVAILERLHLTPSDLIADIESGLMNHFAIDRVVIDCDPEFVFETETVNT
jgi:hypothetical protein